MKNTTDNRKVKEDIDELTKYLDTQLRITIKDTRWFIGRLKCLDKDLNIILNDTIEYRIPTLDETNTEIRQRFIGLCLIGGEFIEKIQVHESIPIVLGKDTDFITTEREIHDTFSNSGSLD